VLTTVTHVAKEDDPQNLRIRIPPDLQTPFSDACRRKVLSKQAVIERLIRYWVKQEDVAQSMIVGQVEPADDLVELVLRRLAGPPAKPEYTGTVIRKRGSQSSGTAGSSAPAATPKKT
jgi:hypothetical protein